MNRAARLWRDRKLATSFVLALGTCHGWASANSPSIEQRIRTARDGSCPTAASVAGEIGSLTPTDRRDVLDELREVSIENLGTSYRVVVHTTKGTKERVYPTAERDCEKRARFVAVFVVLTLMPPEGQATDENVEPPPPQAAAPPKSALAPSVEISPPDAKGDLLLQRWLRLELAATADQGLLLDRAGGVRYFGGSLRAVFGRGAFVPSFGVSYAPSAHFDAGSVHGDLARATAEAGLRARWRRATWELAGQVDGVIVSTRATAANVLEPASDTGIEAGLQAALVLAIPTKTAVEPFLAASARWIPSPHKLMVLPRGDIGALPQLWMGASAGLALAL